MAERGSPEQSEAASFEWWYEKLFDRLEEYIDEAAGLAEDAADGVVPEGGDSAQLWEMIKEEVAGVKNIITSMEFDASNENLHVRIVDSFNDLKQRAEKAFGASLSI